jgi:hypothetical protein
VGLSRRVRVLVFRADKECHKNLFTYRSTRVGSYRVGRLITVSPHTVKKVPLRVHSNVHVLGRSVYRKTTDLDRNFDFCRRRILVRKGFLARHTGT